MSRRFAKKKRCDAMKNQTHQSPKHMAIQLYLFVLVAGIPMGFGITMSANANVNDDGCRIGDVTM